MGKPGNKSNNMKMYVQKTLALQRLILFVEIFANIVSVFRPSLECVSY